MTIQTKYSVGDSVWSIVSPSMKYGGHGWLAVKSKIYRIDVTITDNTNIKYYLSGKFVDTAYENNLFSSEEECSETLGRVIKKYKN